MPAVLSSILSCKSLVGMRIAHFFDLRNRFAQQIPELADQFVYLLDSTLIWRADFKVSLLATTWRERNRSDQIIEAKHCGDALCIVDRNVCCLCERDESHAQIFILVDHLAGHDCKRVIFAQRY